MYTEIKQNIIKNFFNKCYLYTCGCHKNSIIYNIIDKSIFPIIYNYDNDTLIMKLGDGVIITFNFEWEYTSYLNNFNKEMKRYKLIAIK